MTAPGLIVRRAGPAMTVQDMGRPGFLAKGLSRGGAMDLLALAEGAALLNQDPRLAAVEMAGAGGLFEASGPVRVALSGAPMRAALNGAPLPWPSSQAMAAGDLLEIGPAVRGNYGYLHLGGGVDTPPVLGGRGAHLNAGLGALLAAGDMLPAGPDAGGPVFRTLEVENRFSGGTLRVVPSVQTGMFPAPVRDRFARTGFSRDARSNRMALRLAFQGEGFALEDGLTVVSEVIVPGDIQITGDGVPVILMAECQTTGGYPRIGTVLAADMARAAQAPAGAALDCRFITIEEGLEIERTAATQRAGLARATRPLLRDPRDIADLLSYRLVDGAVSGYEEEEEEDER